MISVAFDVRRLVDAHIQRKPYQGITRYTLRLYQELKSRDDVAVSPVYLHPLDPVRVGVETAIAQASALDALHQSFGEQVQLPWANGSAGLLRLLCRLENRLKGVPGIESALRHLQRKMIARSFPSRATSPLHTDIFHSPVNPLPPIGRTPSRHRILTVHDCIYLRRPDFYPLPGRTPAIRHALDSLDASRDFVICDSRSTQRDLLDFVDIPPERTRVVPLTADEQFFTPDAGAAEPRLRELGLQPGRYLLALAQSEKRKNIPRLVEAYQASPWRHEYPLLLVCTSDHAPRLRTTLLKLGLWSDGIHCTTGVDDRSLSGLLALATAFLYVPLYEGFGIPPLEAMAAGCPVLAADNSSIPEVVGNAAIYVNATQPASIGAGLHRILADADLRRRLCQRGRRQAALFSWSRTTEETLQVYREVAFEQQRPSASRRMDRGEAGRCSKVS